MKSAKDTKYRQIAEQLIQEIRDTMGPGDKLPTEVQLAERFGVHFMTVRGALKLLQEGGVIQRQRAIGTTVLNPLGGNWVGILCEMNVFSPHSHSLFHRSVIYYLRKYLREQKIPSRVSIGETEPGSKAESNLTSLDFVADVEANRLAGVIALSVNPNEAWLQKLHKQGIPVIGSNQRFLHNVSTGGEADTQRAVRTLLDYGRTRIAYMGWVESAKADELPPHLEELKQCYPENLRKDWIKYDIHPETPLAGATEFRKIWTSSKEKPNGLIVNDEHMMPDLERTLKEFEIRVPEDLLIIRHRTRGNTTPCNLPTIIMETDPQLYAFRMADLFIRLYAGKKLTSVDTNVSRTFIDDEIRRHPAVMAPGWNSADMSQHSTF
ncbi:GntR family transcriptional regulator [Coraliomargarita algicola]|uniref:GntR family transcriptional regulator n=1 Tax=Coraliomargarita algicola TaxID=3092156 RepID=A0ABZ0RMP0_9BACT|nr:GntR family transcriptional regulator [Coraliomargarita sp. J2-16]WPJ96693.1 GntR family transcriptional regulator [Coraliomargarita sp. J2-16]